MFSCVQLSSRRELSAYSITFPLNLGDLHQVVVLISYDIFLPSGFCPLLPST